MSLNIKNEATHELVRRLAELTGQSQTSAVEEAVRRRLAELEREGDRETRIQRLLEIGRQTAAEMDPKLSNDPNDFLYDDMGLPT
jgi:antitoxin VapB